MTVERDEFRMDLGSVTTGRLRFTRGADGVMIRANAPASDLYRAHFEGTAPEVRAENGGVMVEYPRGWNPLDWRKSSADISLNARIPWHIEVEGGLSRLRADLSGLTLDSFSVRGGVSGIELTLPEPSGAVRIDISGGASDIKIHRPENIAARVRVEGGASKLRFDDQSFGAIGGETTLESPGYSSAADRYEIDISGGVSDVSVTTL